jgi:hypothetical protein
MRKSQIIIIIRWGGIVRGRKESHLKLQNNLIITHHQLKIIVVLVHQLKIIVVLTIQQNIEIVLKN